MGEAALIDTKKAAAVWLPIADLVPWDKNPRNNAAAVGKVAESIERFGFGAPLLARAEDKQIIAGHTRLTLPAACRIQVLYMAKESWRNASPCPCCVRRPRRIGPAAARLTCRTLVVVCRESCGRPSRFDDSRAATSYALLRAKWWTFLSSRWAATGHNVPTTSCFADSSTLLRHRSS